MTSTFDLIFWAAALVFSNIHVYSFAMRSDVLHHSDADSHCIIEPVSLSIAIRAVYVQSIRPSSAEQIAGCRQDERKLVVQILSCNKGMH